MRLAPEDPALGEGDAAHGSDERGQQAGHHRVEEQRIVARLAQVDRARDALQPRPRFARPGGRESGAGGIVEEHEGKHVAGLEVGRAQDQLAEAGLAEVLGEQGDEAPAQLRLGGWIRRDRRAARHLPERVGEPLARWAGVEGRLERLGEPPPVSQPAQEQVDHGEHRQRKDGHGERGEIRSAEHGGRGPQSLEEPRGKARRHHVHDQGEREEETREEGEAHRKEEHAEGRGQQEEGHAERRREAIERGPSRAIPEPAGAVELAAAGDGRERRGHRPDARAEARRQRRALRLNGNQIVADCSE